ncbi:MAG TPA: hypothetical protein PLX08_03810 [Bacteroidales bacterium]|jgi:hypothetical protein|nr:hypothetical protein [Bacteroidales bacterium]
MKRVLLIGLAMLLSAGISHRASGQKPDFSGKWKLDATKSNLPEYTPVLTRINVIVKGDSLLTQRFYDTGDGQEYPFVENLTIDGKEYSITIYDMPRKTKATVSGEDGSFCIESVTSTGSGDFVSKETWKTDPGNKVLTISFKNTMEGNEGTGLFTLNKIE